MTELQDEVLLRIGDIAARLNVSPQTLRVWEHNGLLAPKRSPGGHRLYSLAEAERAAQVALLRRRHGLQTSGLRDVVRSTEPDVGNRIRHFRTASRLTQEALATAAGISRSHLGSIERGDLPASFDILSRIADRLGVPPRELGPEGLENELVVNISSGRRTILDGVAWTELAGPGHTLEPALLEVPPGASSGPRHVSRPGETFFFIISGILRFDVVGRTSVAMAAGDALLLPPNAAWTWVNDTAEVTRALYLEQTKVPASSG